MDGLNWKKLVRLLVTPVTLLALLAVLYFGARWGYREATAPAEPEAIPSCSPSNVGKVLPSSKVTVNIFNGGSQQGLAGKVSRTMKARGFVVKAVDNTDQTIEQTVIVGASKDDPAVKLVAQQLVKPEIREDGITDGIVDIFVGNKFAGWTKTPKPWQIQVSSPPCLAPSSASPTPIPQPSASR